MAYNITKQLVVIPGPTVNLKSTGNTIIFTPLSKFAVVQISCFGVSVTGVIGAPVASFGWTAATYNDLTSGFTSFPTATDHTNGSEIASTIGETPVIPASTAFRINVTAADATATTNSQRIDILGYYI